MNQLKLAAATLLLLCAASNSDGQEPQVGVPLQEVTVKMQNDGTLSVSLNATYARDITGDEWHALAVLGNSWSGLADSEPFVSATSRSLNVLITVPQGKPRAAAALPPARIKRTRGRAHLDRFQIEFPNRPPTDAELQRIVEAVRQLSAIELGIPVQNLVAVPQRQRSAHAFVVHIDQLRSQGR